MDTLLIMTYWLNSMLRKGQEGHVRAEKDLLAAAANAGDSARWIVKLHYSFQVSASEYSAVYARAVVLICLVAG